MLSGLDRKSDYLQKLRTRARSLAEADIHIYYQKIRMFALSNLECLTWPTPFRNL